MRKRTILIAAIAGVCAILAIISVVILSRSDDKENLDMLRQAGWTVANRVRSGVGYGDFSGDEFISGTTGDPAFVQYVTEILGIDIDPDDNLTGYSYKLQEYCFEWRFQAYFLVRDNTIICSAVWAAESGGNHDQNSFYPIDTPADIIRDAVAKEILSNGFEVPAIRS